VKIKSITVIARRWDDYCWNTYFTAEILINGKQEYEIPFTYGHGDRYVQVAADLLQEKGHLKGREKNEAITIYARRVGIEFHYTATDVSRKKDL
jgi:hypothetical protein